MSSGISSALLGQRELRKQLDAAAPPLRTRGTLFRKHLLLLIGLVSAALLANSGVALHFMYQDGLKLQQHWQGEEAQTTAGKIEHFFSEIERQIGWTTYFGWDAQPVEQRRLDYVRLLRQVPAITEIRELDSAGREQLRVSWFTLDVAGSGQDFSSDPGFLGARAYKTWYSPVYLRKQSEPYLTLAIARAGRDPGVTIAEVNLKLIWDVIGRTKVGRSGVAFVVDQDGRLIAHPDISLVLRNTDFSRLPYVAAATRELARSGTGHADPVTGIETDAAGIRVLSAHVVVPKLDWVVFAELPMSEAMGPIYSSAMRSAVILLIAVILASLAAMLLVRRMTVPIRKLEAGAMRVGAGDLDSPIEIRTGDELEELAGHFNTMAGRLRNHHEHLQRTVENRTADLVRSVTRLQALSDVVRAVNSTLDVNVVLQKIVTHAVEIADADAGAIFRSDEREGTCQLAESSGMDEALVQPLRGLCIPTGETAIGEACATRQPVQLPDLAAGPSQPLRESMLGAGFHSALIVPLIAADAVVGGLVLLRRRKGLFDPSAVELTSIFASQSALAMRNAALFQTIEENSRQLELASEHKSHFLANMSHELRTPLNAILGYAELLADGTYGELAEKPRSVIERVLENGRNLLSLINDVLDLSKIEAGQLTLSLEPFSVGPVVTSVVESMQPLARGKGLALATGVAPGIPEVFGDVRRFRQVLVNLAGNAIKFTDAGEVAVHATSEDGRVRISVRDTGPGIAPEDHERIFGEFQQVNDTTGQRKGGTGLGLAISKRIMEMHGGTLSVVSAIGEGATFIVDIPVRPT